MKALTFTQPWASLIALGAKSIETRNWYTSHRGPVAIHAAKGFPRWAMELVHDPEDGKPFRNVLKAGGITALDQLPRGAIVATADLHTVTLTQRCTLDEAIEQERRFGDFTTGRYAWYLGDVVALESPIPARGHLWLWEWDESALAVAS